MIYEWRRETRLKQDSSEALLIASEPHKSSSLPRIKREKVSFQPTNPLVSPFCRFFFFPFWSLYIYVYTTTLLELLASPKSPISLIFFRQNFRPLLNYSNNVIIYTETYIIAQRCNTYLMEVYW